MGRGEMEWIFKILKVLNESISFFKNMVLIEIEL